MAIKLSNVIGAPFSDDVLRQLSVRARRNSTLSRSNEEVLFLANKMAWARLTSSVNVTTLSENERRIFFNDLELDPGDYPNPDSLAQNWILEAGASIQKGNGIALRQGIGPNGAYGLGGTEELGYRPMPGLLSVQVETTGRLGSLRQATITFNVWNMNQLNVIEALYFRLGYSMLLEWGHTQYFGNTNSNGSIVPDGVFVSKEIYGIDNPFGPNRTKETIQQDIARKARKTSGNYDGMLGVVSNFNWSFNQQGGYDCTVRLIGLGAVMDSMRINQAYTLPEGAVKKFKEEQSVLERQVQASLATIQAETGVQELSGVNLPAIPGNPDELYRLVKEYIGPSDLTYKDFIQNYLAIGVRNFKTGEYFDTQFVEFKTSLTNKDLATLEAANEKFGGLWIPVGNIYYNLNANLSTGATLLFAGPGSISSFIEEYFNRFPVIQQNINVEAEEQVGLNPLARLFQYQTRQYTTTSSGGVGGASTNITSVSLDSTLVSNTGNSSGLRAEFRVRLGAPANTEKLIYFQLQGTVNAPDPNRPVTRRLVIQALEKWINSGAPAVITEVVAPSGELIVIKGSFQTDVIVTVGGSSTTKVINWEFETNNPGFIASTAEAQQPQIPPVQETQQPNTGDANGNVNQPDTQQIESAQGFQSALDAMLAIIQSRCQVEALKANLDNPVIAVDIVDITRQFYQGGIFDKVLSTSPNENIQPGTFDLTQFALRGFNADFMAYPDDKKGVILFGSKILQTPTVDFNDLCKAYVVRYPKSSPDAPTTTVRIPVYLQLGYLLAFLNNMCLFYDSKQKTTGTESAAGTEKRPYVYIDFNPETNFCLSSPQQMSIDPFTCLIPLNANNLEYKALFTEGIKTGEFFNPEKQNRITAALNENGLYFKSISNRYQGKIMNILLNIDYLLRVVKEYSNADKEQAVNLQLFLERIVADINKSLGNINALRVAYRDDANTIQIVDDQWVPNLPLEKTLIDRTQYKEALKTDPILAGQLPVFESTSLPSVTTFSLAREFQFKTTFSTKLASMIAISAQAATGSINAKDHSSLSYLNRSFQDRYKPYVEDATNRNKGTNSNASGNTGRVNDTSNDQKAADTFNAHVASIYSNAQLTEEKIEMAKNYYIERMSKVKSLDKATTAAPFIPADLEITIDGISGIIMGNAFTVPESRLPRSLRASDGYTKVGFIVTGLSHTIESNQWLTKIKGQMIKLREDSALRIPVYTPSRDQGQFPSTVRNTALSIIESTPWSAAFISYVMRQAEVSFPSSDSHAAYAQSLRGNSRGFQVLDPGKTKVLLGDLVVKNRETSRLTFGTSVWSGSSHGDIIVSINNNTAVAIGGNVGDTVGQTNIPLTDGLLSTGTASAPNYFVILRPPTGVVSSIINIANREYNLWRTNAWKETTAAAIVTLRQYYSTVGIII